MDRHNHKSLNIFNKRLNGPTKFGFIVPFWNGISSQTLTTQPFKHQLYCNKMKENCFTTIANLLIYRIQMFCYFSTTAKYIPYIYANDIRIMKYVQYIFLRVSPNNIFILYMCNRRAETSPCQTKNKIYNMRT